MGAIVSYREPRIEEIARQVVESLESPSTIKNYARTIRLFLRAKLPLTRDGVQAFLAGRRNAGAAPQTRNVDLAALKKLALEAWHRKICTDTDLVGIERIEVAPVRGRKCGNWLTLEEVRHFLAVAGEGKWGSRNAAVVAVMLGCGFRKQEMARLLWNHYQIRQGRACFADLKGKGNRVRTVAVPKWAANRLDVWKREVDGKFFWQNKPIFQVGPTGIFDIVSAVAKRAGCEKIRPHDLRRTFAQLSRQGGARLEDIQQALGHSSIETTRIYLESSKELREGEACGDQIRL